MAELEVNTGSFQRTIKDLTSGAAGGIAQVLIGKSYLSFMLKNIFNQPGRLRP